MPLSYFIAFFPMFLLGIPYCFRTLYSNLFYEIAQMLLHQLILLDYSTFPNLFIYIYSILKCVQQYECSPILRVVKSFVSYVLLCPNQSLTFGSTAHQVLVETNHQVSS